MSSNKYINTTEVVKMTGCPYEEVMELIKSRKLSSHKTRRGHYRLNVAEVEEYFKLNKSSSQEEVVDKSENTTASQPFNDEKVVSGHTARKYLHCSKLEFERLVEQGYLQAYRDEYRRWRVSKKSILDYLTPTPSASPLGIRLITENFYHEVLERICEAKSSILIATGKIMYVKVPSLKKKGKKIPLVNYLMEKAEQGVSVKIIYSDPTRNVLDRVNEYDNINKAGHFFTYYCKRNHAKAVIIDDKLAYMGSANVTDAGLGQPVLSLGNFELGFLTDDSKFISSLNAYFSKILEGNYCENCQWKDKCIEY